MSKSRDELAKIGALYPLTHPARASIIKLLKSQGKAYIAQIAKKLGVKERTASFHLSVLAGGGFVKSEYGLSNPGKKPPRVVRYYSLTDKVDKAIKDFLDELE